MSQIAHALASALSDLSVRHAFGMPGGATLPLIQAFEQHGIQFILTRHEGSAGFMADAIAQLTGDIGLCVSTLGPGATNLVSGLAQAHLERSRVIALIGMCDESIEPIYTHQIMSHERLFQSVTGRHHRFHPNKPEAQLRNVLRHVTHEPPSPLVLEISARTAQSPCALIAPDSPPSAMLPDAHELMARIQRAERPVFFVGCGDLSEECSQQIIRLSSALSIPVLTTYRAKGMVPETSPWSLGAAGLSPVVDDIQQALLAQCDLILGVGLDPVELRPNWLPGWPEDVPFVSLSPYGQIDLCAPIALDLRGDVAQILSTVPEAVNESLWSSQEIESHRNSIDSFFEDGDSGPATAIRTLQAQAPDDVIVCLDVGAHRITASHVWKCRRPRRLLQSNGLSSMGVGLPYAIASKFHFPEQPVMAVVGDMGLWMALGELGVIQDHGLDVVVVYFSDSALSLIELKQERQSLPNAGVRFQNPRVEPLAEAFGGTGVRVHGQDELSVAVEAAFENGGLQLIEVVIQAQPYRKQM